MGCASMLGLAQLGGPVAKVMKVWSQLTQPPPGATHLAPTKACLVLLAAHTTPASSSCFLPPLRGSIWDTRTRRGKAELEKGKCNLRLERAEGGKGQVLNCPALGCLCSYGKHRHCLEEGDAAVSAIRGPARLATPHTASTQVLLETEDPVHALVLVPARGHC